MPGSTDIPKPSEIPGWFDIAIQQTGDFIYYSIYGGWPQAKPFAPIAIATIVAVVAALVLILKALFGEKPFWMRLPIAAAEALLPTLRKRQPATVGVTEKAEDSELSPSRLGSAANAIVMWCALSDSADLKRMTENSKDGPIQAKYQLNMGLAVLAVSIWSSFAFMYAVYSSGTSFGGEAAGIQVIAIIGGVLYGSLILALDRSIVAPFTPLTSRVAAAGDESGLSGMRRNIPLYSRTIARLIIALLVAKFTAVPIASLIMHDGIANEVAVLGEEKRSPKLTAFNGANEAYRKAQADRTNSTPCQSVQTNIQTLSDKLITVGAEGCRSGSTYCPGPTSAKIQAQINELKVREPILCRLSAQEESSYLLAIKSAQDEYTETLKPKSIDVLTAATQLNKLERRYYVENKESGNFFEALFSRNPIAATFWLLVVIELIPALIKIWRDRIMDRRAYDLNQERRAMDTKLAQVVAMGRRVHQAHQGAANTKS